MLKLEIEYESYIQIIQENMLQAQEYERYEKEHPKNDCHRLLKIAHRELAQHLITVGGIPDVIIETIELRIKESEQ